MCHVLDCGHKIFTVYQIILNVGNIRMQNLGYMYNSKWWSSQPHRPFFEYWKVQFARTNLLYIFNGGVIYNL